MRGQFWSILEYGANSIYSEEGVALIISQKLHEIERIWTPGGRIQNFYYVDPPLQTSFMVALPR